MVIRKIGKQTWRLYSKTTHRNLGTYHSLKAVKARERQVEYFKHLKKTNTRYNRKGGILK